MNRNSEVQKTETLSKDDRRMVKGAVLMLGMTFFLFVAAVSVCLSMTLGWFSVAERLTLTGAGANVECPIDAIQLISATYYKYDSDNEEYVVSDDESDFEMPQYDSVFTERNDMTAVVLRAEVLIYRELAENESIYAEIGCTGDLYETVTIPETGEDKDLVATVLSNFMKFKALAISTDTVPVEGEDATPENIYTSAREQLEEVTKEFAFVTLNDNTPVKVDGNKVRVEIPYDVYNAAVDHGTGSMYIYLLVDYSDEISRTSMRMREDAGLGFEFSDEAGGNIYELAADMTQIEFSVDFASK